MQFPYPALLPQYEAIIVPSYLVPYIKSIVQQYSYQPQGYMPNFESTSSSTSSVHDLLKSAVSLGNPIVPAVQQTASPPQISSAPQIVPSLQIAPPPQISPAPQITPSLQISPVPQIAPSLQISPAPQIAQSLQNIPATQTSSAPASTIVKEEVSQKIEVIKKAGRYADHTVCIDWMTSICSDSKCVYDHYYPSIFKSQLCKYWESGKCKFRTEECRYAHGKFDRYANLKIEPPRYYTETSHVKRSRSRSRERYASDKPLYFIDNGYGSEGQLPERNVNYFRK